MRSKIDTFISRLETILLWLCLALLAFLVIYVYGYGGVRGPLAVKEYYELGDIDKKIAEEKIKPSEGVIDATNAKELPE